MELWGVLQSDTIKPKLLRDQDYENISKENW